MPTCKDCLHDVICPYSLAEVSCDDFKDRSKFIEAPCKVGDYLEWDDGDGVPLYFEVLGFRFNMLGEISRFVTKNMQPIISHRSIKRILTKEEAEQVLKEREKNGR